MAKRKPHRSAVHDPTRPCPCGLPRSYADCCGRLHRSEAAAATAEQLMRSRYAAFTVGDTGYLLRSWHSSTRPARLALDPGQRWTGLAVLDTDRGGMFDATGEVEFEARYRDAGRPGVLRERSRFVREDGDWVYLDAVPEPS